MKHTYRLLSFCAILILMVTSSCKDDEPILTRLELLTQKPWKLKSVTGLGISSPPESTQADDTHTFKADGSYLFDEGGSKDDPADPQTLIGTWEFAENETVIKLNYGGLSFNQEILELTNSTLKVKFTFFIEIEETFGH